MIACHSHREAFKCSLNQHIAKDLITYETTSLYYSYENHKFRVWDGLTSVLWHMRHLSSTRFIPQQPHDQRHQNTRQLNDCSALPYLSSLHLRRPASSHPAVRMRRSLPAAAEWLCASHATRTLPPRTVASPISAPQRLLIMTYPCEAIAALPPRSFDLAIWKWRSPAVRGMLPVSHGSNRSTSTICLCCLDYGWSTQLLCVGRAVVVQ